MIMNRDFWEGFVHAIEKIEVLKSQAELARPARVLIESLVENTVASRFVSRALNPQKTLGI